MRHFLAWSAVASAVSAKTGILLPIYSYPTTTVGQADWAGLLAAIDANKGLDFYVIINDANGPEPENNKPNPPDDIANWAPQIDALNSRDNAHTIGYVYTSQGRRDIPVVHAALDQYAAWTKSGDFNIQIDGIFFDEVNTTSTLVEHYKNITEYAKQVFSGRNGPVVLNPGGPVPEESRGLFTVADSIVQIETCYTTVDAAYDNNDPIGGRRCPSNSYVPFKPASLDVISADEAPKSSVLVHDFYESWYPDYQPASEATLETDIKAIVDKGVHSFYIAQYGWTQNFTESPASIGNVARIAAALQNSS